MRKILIRADGGKDIGMGHIMRMLVLANELKKKCKILFLCKSDKNNKYRAGIERIAEDGFDIELINENDVVNEIIKVQKNQGAELLITDSYDVNDAYFDALKEYFNKTAYMDDINICRINTDIIINQNINANEYKYETFPNKQTNFFLGSDYILLRDEFLIGRKGSINEKVKDIMLTVGGMDNKLLTLQVIKALEKFQGNLHVIIGKAFEKQLINHICNFKSDTLKIIPYENAVMSDVMQNTDLAISACGSTLYELSVMRVPTIGIVVAENQKRIAETMGKKKVIINTDDLIWKDIKLFKDTVFKVIDNFDIRKNLVEESSKCINNCGARNLSEKIMQLIFTNN